VKETTPAKANGETIKNEEASKEPAKAESTTVNTEIHLHTAVAGKEEGKAAHTATGHEDAKTTEAATKTEVTAHATKDIGKPEAAAKETVKKETAVTSGATESGTAEAVK